MPPEITVDVVLSWSRAAAGTTAVLRQVDDARWDELDRTDATELMVRRLTAGRAYTFAAAEALTDGDLAPEDEWETLRVTPLGDDTAPALPSAPKGLLSARNGGTEKVALGFDGVLYLRGSRATSARGVSRRRAGPRAGRDGAALSQRARR